MSARSSYSKGSVKPQKKFVQKTTTSSTSNVSLTASLRQSQSKIEDGHRRGQPDASTRLQMRDDGSWVSTKPGLNFVQYLPQDEAVAAGLGVEDGGLDAVESQRVVDLLNRELSRLLNLNMRDFWREVASDSSLHEFLDSYLQFRSRWYDFPRHGGKETVAGVIVGEFELSRRVFMVLYRISSNKDPGARASESLSAKDHEAFLQEKKLLDLSKLLDICAIYGHDNEELTRLLVNNAIKVQPGVVENLMTAVSHFLSIVHTMHQRCSSLLEALVSSRGHEDHGHLTLPADFLEVMDFINDAIGSLDAFANAYKPAAIYFSYPVEISYGNEELLISLARLHDSLLPSLQQEFAHIFTQRIDGSQNLFGWTPSDICLRFKLLSVRIVKLGWKLFESCYFSEEQFKFISLLVSANKMFPANVEDPAVRGDILVQMFREINGVSSHLPSTNSRTFLQNLEKDYELLSKLIGLHSSGWLFLDDEQLQFLTSHIGIPPSKAAPKDSEVPVSPLTSSIHSVQMDEDTVILESKISQIKDIFPEYGKGFLSACLDVYNQNPEEVIQRILEGTLHKDLLSLNNSLEVPPPKSASSVGRTDKGKGAVVDCTAKSSLNVNVPTADKMGSSSSSHSYGRFIRKPRVDLPDHESLDSRVVKDSIKTAVLASQYEYEDEYDDSFDELGLSVVESGFEEAELRGDRIDSGQGKSSGSGSENPAKTGWWNQKKPQFYVKDGKNYSYKVSGSVAVSNAKEAAMINQTQKDLIYGLGRGGNIPHGSAKIMVNANDEDHQDQVPEVTETQQRGNESHRGRGWGRGARGPVKEPVKEPDHPGSDVAESEGRGNSSNFRGRGRGRGGGNQYRKDRAMKKHFAGLSGF